MQDDLLKKPSSSYDDLMFYPDFKVEGLGKLEESFCEMSVLIERCLWLLWVENNEVRWYYPARHCHIWRVIAQRVPFV